MGDEELKISMVGHWKIKGGKGKEKEKMVREGGRERGVGEGKEKGKGRRKWRGRGRGKWDYYFER